MSGTRKSEIIIEETDSMRDILWDFYNKFHGESSNYLLIILYIPVMLLAVTANVLVIAVVFKYHYMRSVTNYFVVNLSVADLLVTTICMPVAVSQAVSIVWIHGEFMCKLSSYLQGVAVAASVFTITAMSIDRYMAIRNPIAFRRIFNRKSTLIVIIVLWLVALGIFAPVFQGMTLQSPGKELLNVTFDGTWAIDPNETFMPPTFYICSEDFKPLGIKARSFGAVCFLLVYAVPGFVVIMAYSMMGRTLCARKPPFDGDSMEGSASSQQSFRLVRERRRIAWILLLLAVLFALCWLPYNVLRLLVDLGLVDERGSITDILSYCLFFGHANSALNPLVYCFMTRNFRRSVSEILCRSPQGIIFHQPRRNKNIACTECNGSQTFHRRNLLRQRKTLTDCGCGIRLGKIQRGENNHENAIMTLKRNTTNSSSGYDSYVRHSCYTLKNLRPTTSRKQLADRRKVEIEISQPVQSTILTTKDQC